MSRRLRIVRTSAEKIEIFVPPRESQSWKPWRAEGTLIRDDTSGRALRLYVTPRAPCSEKEPAEPVASDRRESNP